MASATATATATMAAAGFDKRASAASSLQTPGSGTFPSEMLSPMAGSPGFLKKDDLKTPITPPSAYLDFLNKMSPAMMSPATTGTSSRFSFADKHLEKLSEAGSEKPSMSPPTSQPTSQPPSQPALSRNTSYDSTTSTTSTTTVSSTSSAASQTSTASTARTRPESPRVIIPPSPFAKPAPRSARTPRRLHIPQSPAFSPAMGSAHSIHSPYSSTPLSAAPWSASFSPPPSATEAHSKPGKVSVRQVVTRTVTYCRTPLDPAPKGKRRKIEVEEVDSQSSSEDAPIKQEALEDHESTPCTATVDSIKDA